MNAKPDVIRFLIDSNALKFGEFKLKSGRLAPYFVNTGSFDSGPRISELGRFYANAIVERGLDTCGTLFGPAYKGVPLAVAASMSLYRDFGKPIGFTFNRKEAKTRGEGGLFVGHPIEKGTRVVITEDVVTAGTTLNEVVPLLRDAVGAEIAGVVVLVDRCERGDTGDESAVQRCEKELGIKVFPIITAFDVISYLEQAGGSMSAHRDGILKYLEQYGAKQ
jgi:orotate phosphoribosyltransferase